MTTRQFVGKISIFGIAGIFLSQVVNARPVEDKDLAQQIFDTMIQVHGVQAKFRPVHAKGIVCHGTFTASKEAAGLSTAAHFQGASVPVIVRFSDGATDPSIADMAPDAGPRGIAIRFNLPGGAETDIVAMSHNGFVVSNGEEFLALQRSVVATDPTKPHPWPVEQFLGAHPAALKFVVENKVIPASFANEAFFSNDSFVFTNKAGAKQAMRYQIVPLDGTKNLSDEELKTKAPNFLIDDLKAHLPKGAVQFHLVAQIPNADDKTNDPSIVWPDDRKKVDLGTISVMSVDAKSDETQAEIGFDPTTLPDGIELSDDPLPQLRSSVYLLSRERRGAK